MIRKIAYALIVGIMILAGAWYMLLAVTGANNSSASAVAVAAAAALGSAFFVIAILFLVERGFNMMHSKQDELIRLQSEQNKLLKVLIRDGRGVQPLPKNTMRDLLTQEEPEF